QAVGAGYGGLEVIRGISIALSAGEMLAVGGANGAGKTTLLKGMGGTLADSHGMVGVFGQAIESYDRVSTARPYATVPQENTVAFEFSVVEAVLMGRAPHLGAFHFETPDDLAIARDAMEHFDLMPLARRSIQELSGGERKRVFLARALAQQARIALLDEPT